MKDEKFYNLKIIARLHNVFIEICMSMYGSNVHESILKCIHSPYNVHILNISQALESIQDTSLDIPEFSKHASFFNFDVSNIVMKDKLAKSVPFLNILENSKHIISLLQESDHIKVYPSHIHDTFNILQQVIDAYILEDEELLEQRIETLEKYLDIVESINLQKSIEKKIEDKVILNAFGEQF